MTERVGPHPLTQEIPIRDGLKARLMRPTDAEAVFDILQADPQITERYITWTAGLKTIDEVREAIKRFAGRPEFRFALEREGEFAGYVGLSDGSKHEGAPVRPGSYEMGYFMNPALRGEGIIPAAVTAIMNKAQAVLPVSMFALYIRDDNGPSQTVAEKLGFVQTEEVLYDKKLDSDERRWEKVVDDNN